MDVSETYYDGSYYECDDGTCYDDDYVKYGMLIADAVLCVSTDLKPRLLTPEEREYSAVEGKKAF